MAKYHINKNGKPAICRASKQPCPLGGDEVHFSSKEEAQAYVDKVNAEEHGVFPNYDDVVRVLDEFHVHTDVLDRLVEDDSFLLEAFGDNLTIYSLGDYAHLPEEDQDPDAIYIHDGEDGFVVIDDTGQGVEYVAETILNAFEDFNSNVDKSLLESKLRNSDPTTMKLYETLRLVDAMNTYGAHDFGLEYEAFQNLELDGVDIELTRVDRDLVSHIPAFHEAELGFGPYPYGANPGVGEEWVNNARRVYGDRKAEALRELGRTGFTTSYSTPADYYESEVYSANIGNLVNTDDYVDFPAMREWDGYEYRVSYNVRGDVMAPTIKIGERVHLLNKRQLALAIAMKNDLETISTGIDYLPGRETEASEILYRNYKELVK